jgi:hypothetical protein
MHGPALIKQPVRERTEVVVDSKRRPFAVPRSGERGAEHRGRESDPTERRITLGSAEGYRPPGAVLLLLPERTSFAGESITTTPSLPGREDRGRDVGPPGPWRILVSRRAAPVTRGAETWWILADRL